MDLELEQRLYHKFANLFELQYEQGKIFELKESPEEIQRDDTIFFNGKLYTYKNTNDAVEIKPTLSLIKSMITKHLSLKLRRNNYRFKGKYLVFREDANVEQPHSDIFEMYNGFKYRTIALFNRLFLCIDPHLIIFCKANIDFLLKQGIAPDQLSDFSVRYKSKEGKRVDGYLMQTAKGSAFDDRFGADYLCKVKGYRDFEIQLVPPSQVFPESRPELLQRILDNLQKGFNIIELQRHCSFLNSRTASKDRLKQTLDIARSLQEVFPLEFGEFCVKLEGDPVSIKW